MWVMGGWKRDGWDEGKEKYEGNGWMEERDRRDGGDEGKEK